MFFSSLKKAVHLGSNPSLDHGYHFSSYGGNDARFLTKGFFRDILSAHYRQTDLKVNTKINSGNASNLDFKDLLKVNVVTRI